MKSAITGVFLLAGLVQSAAADEQKTNFYGYINSYWEKAQDQAALSGSGTTTTRSSTENNLEYSVRDIHFVMQSTLAENYKAFLNLKAPDAEAVEVSNAWVEARLAGDYLSFRLGKLYRPFEIYNEILDAVPTYIGIEPPEMFDNDHLMLTRTTNLMFHGATDVGPGQLRYSATTGNDERGGGSSLPYGLDVRFTKDLVWLVGASYYNTGGRAQPLATDGSTGGGILPWMEFDSYDVIGTFGQFQSQNLTVQMSYFKSTHQGTRRDGAAGGTKLTVADICATPVNTRQQQRFNCAGGLGNYNLNADYTIESWYTRVGYTIGVGSAGYLTPYAQYDNYTNKETVQKKSVGGDNEAGQSDDGSIQKWTAGLVYRPLPPLAAKLDYSLHQQDVMGKDGSYGETRFSFSYYWRM